MCARLLSVRASLLAASIESRLSRLPPRQYCRTLRIWIYVANGAGEAVQLVDGGCVDWTRRLLSDAKERLVINGTGTDRLLAMRGTR